MRQPSTRSQWLTAQVAAVAGEWAEALHWFETACKVYHDSGRHWYCARVRLDWAQVHASRGKPGDRQRAAELLREAQAVSRLTSGQVFIIPDTDGRRQADEKFGYIHPCASFPLSDLEIEIPPVGQIAGS